MENTFSNHILHFDDSRIQSPEATPLAEHYAMVNTAVSIVTLLIIISVALVAIFQPIWPMPDEGRTIAVYIASGVTTFFLLLIGYGYFAEKAKGYCVREQDITLFKGLIFRKVITQPICRIQHIEVKRGPIDRKVNLAKLHVYSAGDIAQTFEVPGLDLTLANSIRNEILAHKDMQHHG